MVIIAKCFRNFIELNNAWDTRLGKQLDFRITDRERSIFTHK